MRSSGKANRVVLCAMVSLQLSACGTVAPHIEEAWEAKDVSTRMAFYIKKNIFCELVNAIKETNRRVTINGGPSIPYDYGVQMQIGLTIEESTAFNPGVTYNRALRSGSVFGSAVDQAFNLAFGGTLSSTATRTDTTYSYYNVGRIAGPGRNDEYCNLLKNPIDRRGSSPLLQSDLGIEDYLIKTVQPVDVLSSSKPGAKTDAKLDVYSYEIKFAVVTDGSINPIWKLVDVSGGSGSPLLNVGRTRTHDLILTFGPNGPGGFEPSNTALQQHFTTQFIQAIERGPLRQ